MYRPVAPRVMALASVSVTLLVSLRLMFVLRGLSWDGSDVATFATGPVC